MAVGPDQHRLAHGQAIGHVQHAVGIAQCPGRADDMDAQA
jgi:putative effector of murein hydrolase